MLEFFMPMIPPQITAQEHKVAVIKGKPVFYDPPELKEAKLKMLGGLYKALSGKEFEIYTKAIRLTVKWLFPKGKHKDGEYKKTKPDTDNLQKMLKDCITTIGLWKDDALVASEICEKFWAQTSGIYIRIEELE